MNKRKWISSALALSLALGTSYLSFAQAAAAEQSQVQTVFAYSVDVSAQAAQLANFEAIKALFTDQVDLTKVKAKYEADFKDAVVVRNPSIHEEISILLNAGVEGKASADQVKQAVDKGLQWFFYDEINALNGEAKEALSKGEKDKAKTALEKAVRLFEGTIYVTAGKRDNGLKTTTQDFLKTIVVPGLRKAVNEGDHTSFNVYRQYFQKTMMKVYVLATAQYAAKVEKSHAEGKTKDALVQMAENYFFFMPIHQYLSGGSQEAADSIRKALGSGKPEQVNSEAIKSQLAEAIAAKVNEYAGKTFSVDLAQGDKSGALIHAAEGNAFASQLEVIISERLGAEVYVKLQQDGQAYFEALEADKTEEAQMHAFKVVKALSQLSGVHFSIGAQSLKADGKEVKFDQVASYLNPETNRTLASTRFIAEALGSQVEWVEATKTIVVTKGDKKVELVVGSKDVIVNGKKDEKMKLNQDVIVHEGRSYIPVRAVADVLGQKVFYYNGEVVIN